jgi:hypothetical protein
MPSLAAIAHLYDSTLLKERTLGAVLKKIPYVLAETLSGGETQEEIDDYNRRQALARTAASSPQMIRDRFYAYILANGTIQTVGLDCTDADIEYVVGLNWSDVAKTV